MPGELTNQTARSSGVAAPGAHIEEDAPSRLVVVTFADASEAEGLYETLVDLNKKKIVNLEDAVFVSKNEKGEFQIDEKIHHEKRSGTVKGAILGTFLGWMLGGPVLGLAGGAIVGRLIGKKMDLGIDQGTIEAVSNDLEQGHTALFILGSARHAPSVIEAFKHFHGTIMTATVDPDVQKRLQSALDEEA